MGLAEKTKFALPRIRVGWWVAATILCVAFGLSHSYSSMAPYDDESYVMLTIETFLMGDRLYAETYTQYGPAYYLLQTPIHGWLGVPLTHDIVRIKTVLTWLLIGGISALIVKRMTRHSFAGLVALMLTVLHLENLGLEPAHPQEVVGLLTVIGLLAMDFKRWPFLILAGVCASFAALTKLNAGAFVAAACLFGAGFSNNGSPNANRVFSALGSLISIGLASGVLVAIAKKATYSGQLQSLAWPLLIVFAIVALCVIASLETGLFRESSPTPTTTRKRYAGSNFLLVALGGIFGTVMIVSWAMANGNSLYEVVYGVVLQHSFMSESFYQPVYLSVMGIPLAAATAVLLATRIYRSCIAQETESIDRVLGWLPMIVLGVAVAMMAADSWKPLVHGLNNRGCGRFLYTTGPLLMPLLIIYRCTTFRLTLAMLASLSPLMAFPVPGTQIAFGSLPILLGLLVSTADACERRTIPNPLPLQGYRSLLPSTAGIMFVATAVFLARWTQNESLQQPGCQWVRLEPNRASKEKSLAESIRNVESNFLAFDTQNHNRFFFWSDKRPLTSISPTFWPLMVTESQKEMISTAALDADSICVVRLPDQPISLGDYAPNVEQAISDRWTKVEVVEGVEIGVQKNRPQRKSATGH